MPIFCYEFDERTEYIPEIMPDYEDGGQTLGNYICKILSADYDELSQRIASLLNECNMKALPYPDGAVSTILSSVFEGLTWSELDKISLVLKNMYMAFQDENCDTKDTALRLYDSIKDYFYYTVLDNFKVIVVLQAYLEECADTPDMLIPEKFELFISGAFEDKVTIVRGKKGASLSEFCSVNDLPPNSDFREVVRDVFSNIMQLDMMIQPDSIADFMASSIFYFFRYGYRFKRCKNCGRFFIPFSRSDELYCDQASPQDETRSCKQYGTERLWYDRMKQDEAAKLARNVYMAKQMLVKRNPDRIEYKRMFIYFKTERKKWETWVKLGEKSKDEYIDWLNEMKRKKY